MYAERRILSLVFSQFKDVGQSAVWGVVVVVEYFFLRLALLARPLLGVTKLVMLLSAVPTPVY